MANRRSLHGMPDSARMHLHGVLLIRGAEAGVGIICVRILVLVGVSDVVGVHLHHLRVVTHLHCLLVVAHLRGRLVVRINWGGVIVHTRDGNRVTPGTRCIRVAPDIFVWTTAYRVDRDLILVATRAVLSKIW
jgi:hypothetical protein